MKRQSTQLNVRFCALWSSFRLPAIQ